MCSPKLFSLVITCTDDICACNDETEKFIMPHKSKSLRRKYSPRYDFNFFEEKLKNKGKKGKEEQSLGLINADDSETVEKCCC